MTSWPVKQNQRAKGLRGLATVRIAKNVVRIAFEEDPENIYEVPVENAPSNVRAGQWFVSLSAKADRMYGFSPINGAFVCKFVRIACPEDQIPAPQHYSFQFEDKATGQKGLNEYDAFTCLLEIVEGKNAGLTIPYFLRYNFGDIDGVTAFTKPKSKYTKQLNDFLEAAGAFDKGTMTFSENILPALESRLQSANHSIMVIMKAGMIDSVARISDDEDDHPKKKSS